MDYSYNDIAGMIDHSLLPPALNEQELEAGCQLAVEYGVASVCIMPYYLKRCAEILQGSGVAGQYHDRFSTRWSYHGTEARRSGAGAWRMVARNWTWSSIFHA